MSEAMKYGMGIAASIVTAAILGLGAFLLFGFEAYVERIAVRTYASGGVKQSEVEEIRGLLAAVDTKLEAADADRKEIRKDIRQIVTILTN